MPVVATISPGLTPLTARDLTYDWWRVLVHQAEVRHTELKKARASRGH